MFHIIEEGKARFSAPVEKKISTRLPVFYNPVMRLNRDFSVMALRALGKDRGMLSFADILAGTGIRGIRLLKETKAIESMTINDMNPRFPAIAKKNLALNKVKATISNIDANVFLYKSKGFDCIDIDPFGSPNPFLDAAITRISRDGALFVTATDTAPLAGTYPETCRRRYWANPLRNHLMHEIGLRILIRRVQLIGADKGRALIPLFSFFHDHYFRACFLAEKGRRRADEIIAQHSALRYEKFQLSADSHGLIGPAWTGALNDHSFLRKMKAESKGIDDETVKFLDILIAESGVDALGFFDLHDIASKTKKEPLRIKEALRLLHEKQIPAAVSQFLPWGIKAEKGAIGILSGRT